MRPATILRAVGEILAPTRCAACRAAGRPICPGCAAALVVAAGPRCARCQMPTPIDVPRCADCPAGGLRASHAFGYAGPMPGLVTALKDGGRTDLARPLAALAAGRLPPPGLGAVLVPVPLSRSRERRRGFNQAALLAHELGRCWGVPVVPALARVRDRGPQRGADRARRARQVAGAFAPAPGISPPPAAVLVDDVHTTGATLSACARTLRGSGVTDIRAVVISRVWLAYPWGTAQRRHADPHDEEAEPWNSPSQDEISR